MSDAMEEAKKAAIKGFWKAVGLLIADDTIGDPEVLAAIAAYEAKLAELGWVRISASEQRDVEKWKRAKARLAEVLRLSREMEEGDRAAIEDADNVVRLNR